MEIGSTVKSFSEIRNSQLEDREVSDELLRIEAELVRESFEFAGELTDPLSAVPQISMQEALDNRRSETFRPDLGGMTEAIIEQHGFPALLIRNGMYVEPRLQSWRNRLDPHRDKINGSVAKVGRIELVRNGRASMVATGWLIDEETIVTNRHVARAFSHIEQQGHPIMTGYQVRIDFLEEHGSDRAAEFGIDQVKFVDLADRDVDLAFLRLERSAARRLSLEPVPVKDSFDDVEFVGVVGYSAFDTRNSTADQLRIFDNIFEVKRLAPGKIISDLRGRNAFQHNATTLGGKSGGLVMDLRTGCAIGLHFGGREGEANFAVKPKSILDRAARISVRVVACGDEAGTRDYSAGAGRSGDSSLETPTGGKPASYADRGGFDPHFLGRGQLTVPFPKLNRLQAAAAAPVHGGGNVLNYRHFSVVMNRKRRLAYYSAVNIDGSQLWAFRRGNDK